MFIEPSVFDEPWPFAFQFHDIKFSLFLLTEPSLPTVKPSLPKAVRAVACVVSTVVVFEWSVLVTPLTASVRKCQSVASLFLIQLQSGWKPTPVIDCVPPLPV